MIYLLCMPVCKLLFNPLSVVKLQINLLSDFSMPHLQVTLDKTVCLMTSCQCTYSHSSCCPQTSCKVAHLIHMYLFGCNYFWMLCEGIYLHTLIVVAVFARKQHLMWYYLLGWGRSSPSTSIQIIRHVFLRHPHFTIRFDVVLRLQDIY